MKSKRAKVLHEVGGRSILRHVLAAVVGLTPDGVLVVVSDLADTVRAEFDGESVVFVDQGEPLGTGHALLQTRGKGTGKTLLIIPGDLPLVTTDVLSSVLSAHREKKAHLTVLTMVLDAAGSYGRLVRDQGGRPVRIVEARDATAEDLKIREANSGIYAVENSPFLWDALARIGAGNAQREYYLPDLVARYAEAGRPVAALAVGDPDLVMGVNSRADLARANRLFYHRSVDALMAGGVTVLDPERTYVDAGASVGRDTVLLPGTHLLAGTAIGEGCSIGPDAWVERSTIEDGVTIRYSVVEGARVRSGSSIGPYAHLRPKADVGPEARVGNFVEVKASRVKRGAKAGHLAYLGDAEVGEGVNIGAGTITCNYDGKKKHKTVIGDRAFIGSNASLVAPVTIGEGAVVGAGSTITEDVPPGTLALGRARQVVKKRKKERSA
jgi:bifunctional UDP-N-acetylglucosamine pyrophosphorylase/glucosamine-1-phosphate N-acetyltransferase